VVLIDDNPADLMLIEESVSELRGMATITGYRSGAQALEAMLQPEAVLPDLLLLDVNMPGMNGFDLLSILKSNAKLKLIPVVMLAGSAQATDVSRSHPENQDRVALMVCQRELSANRFPQRLNESSTSAQRGLTESHRGISG